MRTSLCLVLVLTACGGSGAPDDIVAMCTTLTECGAIAATDTDTCVSELDHATPDSASRAASECATCFDAMTCADVESGKCATACGPFLDTANATPGTVMVSTTDGQSCSTASTDNYAMPVHGGGVDMHLTCGGQAMTVGLGSMSVGKTVACADRQVPLDCTVPVHVTGTLAMTVKDGRRWVSGTCSCDLSSIAINIPYRMF